MGRPKKQFSEDIMQKIEEYALNNCHFETIAMALEIPVNTLKRRFGRFIRQKRAEGRVKLRANQVKLSKNHPAMAIFLGKNELGQVDKQTLDLQKPEQVKLDQQEVKEAQKIANVLNLEEARKGKAG